MTFYLILAIATVAIIFLQYLTWKKSKTIFLPVATFFLYYWTLFGAWFIVYDLRNNNGSAAIGVHYYDYFEKLFPIQLNSDYALSLILYSLFIICFQLGVYVLVRKKNGEKLPGSSIQVFHQSLIVISLVSAALSFFFIYRQMLEAAQQHQSFYIFISLHNGKFYSLYQVFKSCSLLTAFSGLVIYLNGDQANFIRGNRLRGGVVAYIILMLIVMFYSMILGNRHDLVVAGLFSLILYLINGKKIFIKDILLILAALILPVFLIELTRGIPILDYIGLHLGGAPTEENMKLKLSGHQALISLLLSNEIFVGHMSMYGAVHNHLPFTYGSSFSNLIASLVPRFIQPDRPQDIYQYYITVAQNPGLQGFTINHATAWYLNFGIPGIVIGGALLGICVSFLTNLFHSGRTYRYSFLQCLEVIALPGIISFIPMLIRTGPEGYKSLIFEGILIPTLLIWIASIHWKRKNSR